ncbi:LysR family transcriptional regulator [Leeia sp. TBRC 13508]|uniref:LysR family transcriptional regulator n=1 Tax=Leeia speluncae TaxID=2884804 RepID=A0ABS8DAB8_9NEIS|nr:LysR family transcriptional regulator [Leeia speluncae]MCB6185072.1 LysR family transcriptional regulator [Leeia speluncae]
MNDMHHDLGRIDLNLLLVFDSLYRHESVVGAADELSISPSAFSHALTRLRDALSDPLFMRYGNRMQPTIRAEQIAPVVAEALSALSGCLSTKTGFDPLTSTKSFVFAATDYTAFALLPMLIAHLQQVAPGLRTKVIYSNGRDSQAELKTGEIDFALGLDDELGSIASGIDTIDCFVDEYVVVVRKDHPTIHADITLEQYLDARHIVVTPWNEPKGVIDRTLEKLGHRREVSVQLPSLMAAPFIVGSTDLLITLPKRVATTLQAAASVKLLTPPFKTPNNILKIHSSAKYATNLGHKWIKEQILRAID